MPHRQIAPFFALSGFFLFGGCAKMENGSLKIESNCYSINIHPSTSRNGFWIDCDGKLQEMIIRGRNFHRKNIELSYSNFDGNIEELGFDGAWKMAKQVSSDILIMQIGRSISKIDLRKNEVSRFFLGSVHQNFSSNWLNVSNGIPVLEETITGENGSPFTLHGIGYHESAIFLSSIPLERFPPNAKQSVLEIDGGTDIGIIRTHLGETANTFASSTHILACEGRRTGPVINEFGVRDMEYQWVAYDLGLKPVEIALCTLFNQRPEVFSRGDLQTLALAERNKFAVFKLELDSIPTHLFLATWKKLPKVYPIFLDGEPIKNVMSIKFSPDEKKLLITAHSNQGDGGSMLLIGDVIEVEDNFTVNLRVHGRFDGLFIQPCWSQAGDGFLVLENVVSPQNLHFHRFDGNYK